MKNILEGIISHADLGFLPSIGVVMLFGCMTAIIFWTFRPKNAATYQKDALLILDKEEKND